MKGLRQQVEMQRWYRRGTVRAGIVSVVAAVSLAAGPAWAGDQWTKPTAEELKMTEMPGYPGAPAVILNREEITKDDLHVMLHYERIKILTEKGKDKANVELRFSSAKEDGFFEGEDKNITDISGRTIHADGTIIPFTGKPYLKTFENNKEYTYQARVFTLPDVEVGSIIEFRYATRISDYVYEAPNWYLQDELYTKNAHFVWYPTTRELSSEEGTVNSIAWFPILPPGATVQQRETPGTSLQNGPQKIFEVTVHDVAPQPTEEYMPPIASFSYRVLFYYTPFRTALEFWKSAGKKWSKGFDSFANPDDNLRTATATVVAGAANQEAKLQNIYAKVMSLENTDYTRSHGRNEDKAAGLGKVSNASDVLQHERGNSYQLTELFVGMARAAGMKAYGMLVPDREHRLFTPGWLYAGQFDGVVAIVVVDGKERFFDPGSRYCPFGHLTWQSTFVQGMRQTDSGTDFTQTPGEPYTATKTQRVADLTADEHGELHGTMTITYIGATALHWRQRALRGDDESLKHGLRTSLEEMLPKTLEVKVESIENVKDYEKPLIVQFRVKGAAGTATGKRLILPADVFTAEDSGTFPHEKREVPVYFHYAQSVQDAVRIKYPATMSLEASPADTKSMFQSVGQYTLSSVPAANSITVRRNYLFNSVIIVPKDYPGLRTFYSNFETRDKDSIVLKMGAPADAAAKPAPAGD